MAADLGLWAFWGWHQSSPPHYKAFIKEILNSNLWGKTVYLNEIWALNLVKMYINIKIYMLRVFSRSLKQVWRGSHSWTAVVLSLMTYHIIVCHYMLSIQNSELPSVAARWDVKCWHLKAFKWNYTVLECQCSCLMNCRSVWTAVTPSSRDVSLSPPRQINAQKLASCHGKSLLSARDRRVPLKSCHWQPTHFLLLRLNDRKYSNAL